MYRLRIKRPGILILPLVFLAALSCGFMDLRLIGYSTKPEKSGEVLSGEYSPVSITFDTAMDRQTTEGIIKISSDSGIIDGDVLWAGDTLIFTPVSPWTAGTRYLLNLSGLIRSVDGRELRLEKYIFFYAINKAPHPLVEWFCPADGASVRAVLDLRTDDLPDQKPIIELQFSCPMDRLSVETAFTIESVGEKKFCWSDDDTFLAVAPEKNLSPWTSYRWTLKSSAKSRDGALLAKAVSARFITDGDRQLPCVQRVYPALFSQGRWLATGGSVETHLGPGQGIVVEFNKNMADSALNAIRFDPSLTGRCERISGTTMVFIPTTDPQPEIFYTLIVSADAKDEEGLKTGTDFTVNFTPDIPYLQILSFNVDGMTVLDGEAVDTAKTGGNLYDGQALPVPVDIPGGYALRFTIRFSLPFDPEAKQTIHRGISLSSFFPGTLAPVALRYVTWLSDDRLRMEWEGLKPGTEAEPHFYRLTIPGGRGGINTGAGMYFRENLSLILEAQ